MRVTDIILIIVSLLFLGYIVSRHPRKKKAPFSIRQLHGSISQRDYMAVMESLQKRNNRWTIFHTLMYLVVTFLTFGFLIYQNYRMTTMMEQQRGNSNVHMINAANGD